MTFGLWASIVAFVLIEGDALLDQSEIGHASFLFMFGTACLAAAACIALFAMISAVGLVVSAAFSEVPDQHQSSSPEVALAATAAQLAPPLIRPPVTVAPARSRSRSPKRVTSKSRKGTPAGAVMSAAVGEPSG
jgi:hypothetical protein